MGTNQIRKNFLEFFARRGHAVVPSSAVVPHDDPTLLFTNAGMNQFKNYFLGKAKPTSTRAATSQKCIRAGGKHNDLENVGHTSRHCTFFEMLGNFSFGDYFKRDAIAFAWEVSTQVFGFDPDRIWPTVYKDDDEAFELWTAYVPASRITRFGEKENFWAMGDTGPCGPCSELLYDRGPEYGSGKCPSEDPDGERFLEYWNLVFMQFQREANGTMTPLPKQSIDTGSGLERVAMLKSGVPTVYGTDTFQTIFRKVEELSDHKYHFGKNALDPSFHVIADHLRSLSFAIADGAQPSNEGRGYVLRKILRRAVRYGRKLGFKEPFLAKVLPALQEAMGEAYPEIITAHSRIAELLTIEEESFIRTLTRGGNLLAQVLESAKANKNVISGDDAFKLKDTYGYPLEEVELIAIDEKCTVDHKRFAVLEEEARQRSKQAHKVTAQLAENSEVAKKLAQEKPSHFIGYEKLETAARISHIICGEQFVERLHAGEEGFIILDTTPFYAEMGGQAGDSGQILAAGSLFAVSNTQGSYGQVLHAGKVVDGSLEVGQKVEAKVDATRRKLIASNHTATHILHWALCEVLGSHVRQAGSVVDNERIRFDFAHHKAVSAEELARIEDMVNERIRQNDAVATTVESYSEVQNRKDIKQFFADKYGSHVRVVDIGGYSKELCGGTHVKATGQLGYFKIAKESSISAGSRRIEAATGFEAEKLVKAGEADLAELAAALKTHPGLLKAKLERLIKENDELAASVKNMEKNQLKSLAATLLTGKTERVVSILAPCEISQLAGLAECLQEQMGSRILVLGHVSEDKCQLIVRVSPDLVAAGHKASDIIKELAPLIDGKGGGKADSAQAGGKNAAGMKEALAKACALLPC